MLSLLISLHSYFIHTHYFLCGKVGLQNSDTNSNKNRNKVFKLIFLVNSINITEATTTKHTLLGKLRFRETQNVDLCFTNMSGSLHITKANHPQPICIKKAASIFNGLEEPALI